MQRFLPWLVIVVCLLPAAAEGDQQLGKGKQLFDRPSDASRLWFFIGYAGWSPGQLDREMANGSWHVVPASDEHIFVDDPRALWNRLAVPREYRAAIALKPT